MCCWLLVVCVLSIHSCQSVKSSPLNRHYLFLSSLTHLSGLSLRHSYGSIYIYICLIATENSSVFNLCCMEPGAGACSTQSHSFHPLTIHLQTHSHSTDHSPIPQAHAIIPLHRHDVIRQNLKLSFFDRRNVVRQNLNLSVFLIDMMSSGRT